MLKYKVLYMHIKCHTDISTTHNKKKSELMLIRCARAYGSSCLQLISVYLHPFCCTMLIPLTSTSPYSVQLTTRPGGASGQKESLTQIIDASGTSWSGSGRCRFTLMLSLRIRLAFAPLSLADSGGTPLTQWHEILSENTRDIKLSYSENPKSLSHLVLKRYRVVTDRRTDGQTELP